MSDHSELIAEARMRAAYLKAKDREDASLITDLTDALESAISDCEDATNE